MLKRRLLKGPKQMGVAEEVIKEPGNNQLLIRLDHFNLCLSDLRFYEGAYSGLMG